MIFFSTRKFIKQSYLIEFPRVIYKYQICTHKFNKTKLIPPVKFFLFKIFILLCLNLWTMNFAYGIDCDVLQNDVENYIKYITVLRNQQIDILEIVSSSRSTISLTSPHVFPSFSTLNERSLKSKWKCFCGDWITLPWAFYIQLLLHTQRSIIQ